MFFKRLGLTEYSRQDTQRRFVIALVWMFIDAVTVFLAYTTGFLVRSLTAPLNYTQHLIFIGFAIMVTIVVAYLLRVYQQLWARTSGHGVVLLVMVTSITAAVTVTVDLMLTPRPVPLSVVLLGNGLTLFGMTALRYRSRLLEGLAWRWKAVWDRQFPTVATRVLIVGAGQSGQDIAGRLRDYNFQTKDKKGFYKVVGFVDDDDKKRGYIIQGAQVMGARWDIPQLVATHNIDLLILAIHNISGNDFREIQSICWDANVKVKIAPDPVRSLDSSQPLTLSLRDVQPEDILGRSQITRHESVDLTPVIGKRVLITGAAGSIGSELSRQIATYSPLHLLILDNNESALHSLHVELQAAYPQLKVTPLLVDVTRRANLARAFERHAPQVVFHTAAYKHVPMMEWYPDEAIRVNVGGTRNTAELAQAHHVERFVLISTDKAVDPSSVMGASKRLCELLVGAMAAQPDNHTLYTAVRFGNVLGSRGSVLPTFINQLQSGGPLTVTDKRMTRYFMSIPEAVNLVIHAACLTNNADIFLLRMGETVAIWDVAERIIRMHGLRPKVDIDIVEIGIRPGEKLEEVLHEAGDDPQDTRHPWIYKLSRPSTPANQDQFFQQVEALKHIDLIDCDNPLEQIMQVVREATRQPSIEG